MILWTNGLMPGSVLERCLELQNHIRKYSNPFTACRILSGTRFRLADFKRKRKFAGSFFSIFTPGACDLYCSATHVCCCDRSSTAFSILLLLHSKVHVYTGMCICKHRFMCTFMCGCVGQCRHMYTCSVSTVVTILTAAHVLLRQSNSEIDKDSDLRGL